MRAGLALAAALAAVPGRAALAGQEPEAAPRYGAASGCFSYGERVTATTRSEAWYDSLALRVRSPEGDAAPDASGLLGGRWHGLLDSAGRWTETTRPFVPDEVRQVMDLGDLMADFLPHGPAHRVIARDDTLATTRGALAARTTGDETRILEWGSGALPSAWERHLESVTTARADGGEVIALVQLERSAWVAAIPGECGEREAPGRTRN